MAQSKPLSLVVTWADVRALRNMEKGVQWLGANFPKTVPRIMNQVGGRARTKVVRALTSETGLKRDVVRRAVQNSKRAFTGSLTYDLRSRGGNIRLKYLNPRETEAGVTATPFGKRTLYPGTFMKGGTFPERKVVSRFDGHVMFRNGTGRHYTFARSGVFIPEWMIKGITKDAFEGEVTTELPIRIDRVLRKLLP
jgi:hypothetical protein